MRTAIAIMLLCSTPAFGQFAKDVRIEDPKTPAEFWRAVTFELNTGKYDTAAYYLKGFVASNPSDQDLTELEQREGVVSFLRLRNVATWSADKAVQDEAKKNAEEVIAKVAAAVEKRLNDQTRINKFIANLRASKEERAYAITQLQRSGARAVPGLISALQADADAESRTTILNVLPLLPEDAVAPQLAALTMVESRLRYQVLQSLGQRSDFPYLAGRTETNPLPTLDYLSAAKDQPEDVRRLAKRLITRLRPVAAAEVRPAAWELTDTALRFYRHQEKFINPVAVPVWRVDGSALVLTPSKATQAEEIWGLQAARWALELDPTYLPAQVAFLSLAVDKAMERAGLDADLAKAAPEVNDRLATSSATALIAALDQAIVDQRTPVALALVRALGERAEIKAAQGTHHRAGTLQRALDYPDRRVQLAAAAAMLRLPSAAGLQNQTKIVELLRRTLAGETDGLAAAKPRVLIGQFDVLVGQQWGKAFAAAGYEVVLARTGHEVMKRLARSNDIDALVIAADLPYTPLPDLLASLRGDRYAKSLPVRVVISPVDQATFNSTAMEARLGRATPQTVTLRTAELQRHAETERNVYRLTDGLRGVRVVEAPFTSEIVKTAFVQETPGVESPPLTAAERKKFAAQALELLRQAGLAGYDLRPADRAIRQALKSDDLAKTAIDIVGRLPGREAQIDLSGVVLGDKRPVELRLAAADALIRHIQRFGMGLPPDAVAALKSMAAATKEPELRGRVAAVVGALPGESSETGQRLRSYQPPAPGAAPAVEPEKPAAKPENPPANPDDK